MDPHSIAFLDPDPPVRFSNFENDIEKFETFYLFILMNLFFNTDE
jgi:hypothetical protein